MRVDDAMFEASLARALDGAPEDPALGLFGPETVYWQVTREAALFLGAGRATLLQLAHPFVAQGVADHSRTKEDPFGRFHRTFARVYAMTFGSRAQALEAARAVRRIHGRIAGRLTESAGPWPMGAPYSADEGGALMWVHATLAETAVMAYETVIAPLTDEERASYYADSRRFAFLFGVPENLVPANWEEFKSYCRHMAGSEELTVTAAARDLARFVLHETRLGPLKGVPRWYLALTGALMPERLRADFGLPWDQRQAARADRALAWLRRTYALTPARLRYVAPYWEARGRLAGRTRPGPVTATLNRLWIGREAL